MYIHAHVCRCVYIYVYNVHVHVQMSCTCTLYNASYTLMENPCNDISHETGIPALSVYMYMYIYEACQSTGVIVYWYTCIGSIYTHVHVRICMASV